MVANCVSASKALVAIISGYEAFRHSWNLAFILLLVAILLEMVDGPIARKYKTASNTGNGVDVVTGTAITFCGIAGLLFGRELSWYTVIVLTALFAVTAVGVNTFWHKTRTSKWRNAIANNANRAYFVGVMIYLSWRYLTLGKSFDPAYTESLAWLFISVVYFARDPIRAIDLWKGEANH